MKSIHHVLFVITLTIFVSYNVTAQTTRQGSVKTETLKVLGNCSMCEERIEKAASDMGAINASWDSRTKILTYRYDNSRTNPDDVSAKLASVGHDTEKHKASDKVYKSLPGCCRYERTDATDKSSDQSHKH